MFCAARSAAAPSGISSITRSQSIRAPLASPFASQPLGSRRRGSDFVREPWNAWEKDDHKKGGRLGRRPRPTSLRGERRIGGATLGLFFIATDYVTSPNTKPGQLVFGAGCGLLTFIIRTWGGYPEGVAFAVLLMNALTPVIDRYLRPRILGRDWRGAPLNPESERAKS